MAWRQQDHHDGIEEDIEEHVHHEQDDHRPRKQPAVDDIDEDIGYDDDFEEVSAGEDEEYQPAIKAPSPQPPPPPPEPEKPNKVTIRPPSSQSSRPARPMLAKEPSSMADIKKALESENQKLARAAPPSTPPTDSSRKKGALADYESTMPKFNLGGGASAAQKAAQQRLAELRALKVLDKRTVEKIDLFQQRPQKDISLFLAGKSLKYCRLKSVSCQTGDDDVEVGITTDEVWNEDKEMQFPTLTMGQTGKTGGEPSQMLPFLRRVLPLFEASMAESRRRQEASGAEGASRQSEGQASSLQANCRLPDAFTTGCLGASVQVVDISICPQWYGADHAVALYCWPEARREPSSSSSSSLVSFGRRLRSLAGVFPVLSSTLGGGGGQGASPRPARLLYAFCRLSSLTAVEGRGHLVVAGSEMGSLLVWDLRAKAHAPPEIAAAGAEAAAPADPELAHLEGPIWLPPTYSTDLLAFSPANRRDQDEDDLDPPPARSGSSRAADSDLGGLHSSEICCVRCSDAVGGDALVFALDLSGVVSFWRVLELANQSVRLAIQGSLRLAAGARLLGDFLGASYLCIHPQQQAQFVVVSTSGLRQAHRKRSSSVADGPSVFSLTPQEDDAEMGPFVSQPCSAAFNPFMPGLLLAACAEGDLALFDSTLCVPVVHWGSAVAKAPCRTVSVAWSTQRPCVFFVKANDALDVWDLAAQPHAPVQTIELGPFVGGAAPAGDRLACAELSVGPDGRPVVGHGGCALVIGLPDSLILPLQSVPKQHARAEKPVDELVVDRPGPALVLPTLAKHRRTVAVPARCAVERLTLERALAAMPSMQAAVR